MADDSKPLKYVSVILEGAIDKALDYSIPPEMLGKVTKGMAVDVPVRGSIRRGYILELLEESAYKNPLPLHDLACEGKELINDELFELALWMSKYYCCNLGLVLKAMLPAGVRKNTEQKTQLEVRRLKSREDLIAAISLLRPTAPSQALVLEGMLKVRKNIFLSELLEQTGSSRSSVDALVAKGLLELKKLQGGLLEEHEYFKSQPKKLGKEQQEALDKILSSFGSYKTHLLYGVTGSGKTEVYLQAIEACLNQGKSALILVPEIALTTQTYERFRSRFDHKIALLHHRLSEGERSHTWSLIRSGEIRIVLGARSAVFSPMKNLGLVIVDEEHEPSYKQTDDSPSYHARDVAIMRGFLAKAPVVLGSATPSLESYFNVTQKKYELSILKARQGSGLMAAVEVIDMKRASDRSQGPSTFSDQLLSAIKERLEVGEQTILFLNRRGYHTTQICTSCSHVVECPHCDVSLAFHHNENTLSCHLCGFQTKPSSSCPSCKKDSVMRYKGIGTELVERALHAVLPEVRTLRLDADTTKHKGSHEKLIHAFRTGKADVLIGTQMVTKGLHFPSVTLVGVLSGDASLSIPDFRASEHAFQLLTQVAGRAGRTFSQGKVIIQTFNPTNPLIELAAAQDYTSFYEQEVESRKLFDYPPYLHMIRLLFSGTDKDKVFQSAVDLWDALQQEAGNSYQLNPVIPTGHAKVKDKYRFQIILRGKSVYAMNQKIQKTVQKVKIPAAVALYIDVDPLSTFF